MRNNSFSRQAILLPAVLLLFACQNQELDIVSDRDGAVQGREMIITADLVDGTADTRTSSELVEGGKTRVYWSPGDQIKVFSAGESSVFTSQNTAPSRTAKFKGTVSMIFGDDGEGEVDYIWGLYPNRADATYSEPAGSSATALITTTLPSVQQGKEDSFADGTFITIGRSAESLRIPFKGVCTGVYITFENDTDIDKVTLSGLDNEVLAGRFTAGLNEGADGSLTPYVASVSEPSYKVTVVAPDGGTFKKGKMYYIITLPVKFTRGFSLTAHKTTGETGSCSITPASAPEFKVNAIGSVKKVDNRITNWVQTDPPSDEIWYTTKSGLALTFTPADEEQYGIADYSDYGVIKFDSEITEIPDCFLDGNTDIQTITLPECVVTVNDYAFDQCSSLSEITMNGVKHICENAFHGCAFEELVLPEGLEALDASAFSENQNLQRVVMPQSITSVGKHTLHSYPYTRGNDDEYENPFLDCENPFSYCGNLRKFEGKLASEDNRYLSFTDDADNRYLASFAGYGVTSYTVPGDIKYVLNGAFRGCPSLVDVTFQEGLKYIGDVALMDCQNLAHVTVPASVSIMGCGVFYGSQNLMSVDMKPATPPDVMALGNYFYGGGANLFPAGSDVNLVVYVPASSLDLYKTELYWKVYKDLYEAAQELNEVWYTTTDGEPVFFTPYDVDRFGISSFSDYGVIRFNSDITEIPEEFLASTSDNPRTNLKTVSLPDGVEKIGSLAFYGCSSLSEVRMGNAVKTIDTWAFEGCDLTSVNLPESLLNLLDGAFTNNPLTTVRIPSGIVDFSANPFEGCDQLTSFTGGGQNVIVSDDGKFLKDADGRMLSFACGTTGEYTVPDGVTSIDGTVFKKASLSKLVLPATVSEIVGWNFMDCPNLTEVVINSTALTVIGDCNFVDCPDLLNIRIMSAVPPLFDPEGSGAGSCFVDLPESWKVWVPVQSYEAYLSADGWKEPAIKDHIYRYITSMTNPPSNEIWYTSTYDRAVNYTEDGVTGNTVDTDNCIAPADNNGIGIIRFTAPLTQIDIGALAHQDIKSVAIPESVTVIKDQAFSVCPYLTEMTIPSSVVQLGSDPDPMKCISPFVATPCTFRGKFAMSGGDGLVVERNGEKILTNFNSWMIGTFEVPSDVTMIAPAAFLGTRLDHLYLPEGIKSIGDLAMANSSSLMDITLPASLTTVGSGAFMSDSRLSWIKMESSSLPAVVDYIGAASGVGVFDSTGDCPIFVPSSMLDTYKTTAPWNSYASRYHAQQQPNEVWYTVIDGCSENDAKNVTPWNDWEAMPILSITRTLESGWSLSTIRSGMSWRRRSRGTRISNPYPFLLRSARSWTRPSWAAATLSAWTSVNMPMRKSATMHSTDAI